MALVVKNLWVKQGTLNFPGRTVPFWGLASSQGAPPTLPGPTIEAVTGDTVYVVLRNNAIPQRVSVMFPGQRNVWVMGRPWGAKKASPRYEGGRMISLTDYLEPGRATSITYTFEATRPGVFLYESGTNPANQVQMGLYGVIIVRPPGYNVPSDPNYKTAYGAGTGTRFDIEKTMVIGELDSLMHEALAQGAGYNILDYSPDYWVINGRSYPDTLRSNYDPQMPSQPLGSSVAVRTGRRLLIRVVNVGFQNHTFHLGGIVGRVVAGDGYPFTSPARDTSYRKTAITLGSGQSFDIIITPEYPGEFYLRDRDYNHVVNGDVFPGGMMTRVDVTP